MERYVFFCVVVGSSNPRVVAVPGGVELSFSDSVKEKCVVGGG